MSELLLDCSSPSDKTLAGALIEAAASKNAAVQKLLLPKVADTTVCDDTGRTALHCAAHHGDVDGIKLVSSRSPQGWIEARDGEGETLLMSAVRGGQSSAVEGVIKFLCDQNADVNAQSTIAQSTTTIGRTALMLAAEHPNRALGAKMGVQLLNLGATPE